MVNFTVKDIVHGAALSACTRNAASQYASRLHGDLANTSDALEREWNENDIRQFVQIIAGQEMGTKTEHLAFAAKEKYAPTKC